MINNHHSKFSNLSNWKEAWKNHGFTGIRTREYQCDVLATELWSFTLGARSIYWVHIFLWGVKWCEVLYGIYIHVRKISYFTSIYKYSSNMKIIFHILHIIHHILKQQKTSIFYTVHVHCVVPKYNLTHCTCTQPNAKRVGNSKGERSQKPNFLLKRKYEVTKSGNSRGMAEKEYRQKIFWRQNITEGYSEG